MFAVSQEVTFAPFLSVCAAWIGKNKNDSIKEATSKAESANLGGTSATVAWSTNPDAMLMRIPQQLTIGEIVNKGSFAFQQDAKARIGGLDVAENLAGRILTGL